MQTRFSVPCICMLAVACIPFSGLSSDPVIGMVTAQSGLTLDNSRVSGNATLFDGSVVHAVGYSRIQLRNGSRLDLAAGSHARVFANSALLEGGMSEIQSSTDFEIDAGTLKIRPSGANSIARVSLKADQHVLVTALNAPVDVRNGAGLLVARVSPGSPLSFTPQLAARNSFDGTGCVLQKSGVLILVDRTGNQVFELREADLSKAAGNVTRVVGQIETPATPSGGATQVVKVTGATVVAKGGCASLAGKLGAVTTPQGLKRGKPVGSAVAAGAPSATDSGTGIIATPVLIVVGIAVAAAVAVSAAAAAGAFNTTSP